MPASGYRNNNDGSLNNVRGNGNYWSASPNNNNAYNLNQNVFQGLKVRFYAII